MRTLPRSILLLAALFALFTAAAGLAQTPQTPQNVPLSTEEFLATLSVDPGAAPGGEVLPPSPRFLQSTTCTSHEDCPTGQLCCYPCGIPDCEFVCMTPWRKGICPPIA